MQSSVAKRTFILAIQLGLIAVLLLAWQFAAGRLVDDLLVSRPSEVMARFMVLVRSGVLAGAVVSTLEVVALGLLLGSLAGYLLGILAGLSRGFGVLALPWIDVIFAIPKIAVVPLFILWFGVGIFERSMFTALVVFFFMFYAVLDGFKALPEDLVKLCRLLNASPLQRIVLLYVPATFAWTFAGLRIATPYAFVSAISAEVINARSGLGSLVRTSGSMLDTPGMIVGILTAMVCATLAGSTLAVVDRRLIEKLRPKK